ncbi:hypothetical protein [Priestia megaterium]|uniref:hypothetical protein n=1 Tax=Priestia megaterium TaxID=1404 RepID=UPI003CFDC2BA
MKKFALLVGNGFTLDFVETLGFHSSFPLQNFNNRDINYDNFLDKLPTVKNELFEISLGHIKSIQNYKDFMNRLPVIAPVMRNAVAGKPTSDFEIIENYLSRNQHDYEKECQLRRFLAMAYSKLQYAVDSYEDQIRNWKWAQWITENSNDLKLAISFNYDLVLENALSFAGVTHRRIGTDELVGQVPVLKPHGSMDFDLPDFAIKCDTELRWDIVTGLNDAQFVQTVPKSEWFLPRMEADIIPPSMRNFQRHLSWVDMMFQTFENQASELDAFIIVGSSYWDVDRPEINFFLEKLPKTAVVYIMNPRPNPDLIQTLSSLGLSYKIFDYTELPW